MPMIVKTIATLIAVLAELLECRGMTTANC